MEPISEKQQRKVYEWLYPELQRRDWRAIHIEGDPRLVSVKTQGLKALAIHSKDLYLESVPNYQFFFTEIVPRLRAERVNVRFGFAGDDYFYIDPIDADDAYGNPDPNAALAEYVEVC